jgi:hypothetical protein
MTLQAELLADVVRRERELATSPLREERRRMADLVAAMRCCTGPSFVSRVLDALRPSAASCCAAS